MKLYYRCAGVEARASSAGVLREESVPAEGLFWDVHMCLSVDSIVSLVRTSIRMTPAAGLPVELKVDRLLSVRGRLGTPLVTALELQALDLQEIRQLAIQATIALRHASKGSKSKQELVAELLVSRPASGLHGYFKMAAKAVPTDMVLEAPARPSNIVIDSASHHSTTKRPICPPSHTGAGRQKVRKSRKGSKHDAGKRRQRYLKNEQAKAKQRYRNVGQAQAQKRYQIRGQAEAKRRYQQKKESDRRTSDAGSALRQQQS